MNYDKFPCTGCGCCCKKINVAVDTFNMLTEFDKSLKEEFKFPYYWDETGRCDMLDENNHCKVYETRPTICNVDNIMDILKIPKKEFYDLNITACNTLMDEMGSPEDLRIK